MKKYVCPLCGYEMECETRPEMCPVCGAEMEEVNVKVPDPKK